jgi:hypothetical protein
MTATIEDVRHLKRIAPAGPYDDAELIQLIDDKGMNGAAAELWQVQVSASASLVDVTESGSSRKLSQAYDRAKSEYEYYLNLAEAEVAPPDLSGTAISRLMTR